MLPKLAVYILKFLHQGTPKTALVYGNEDCILSETAEDSGIMQGQLVRGGSIQIPLTSILKIEQYKVTYRAADNGQSARSITVSEKKLEEILDAKTDQDTGEVKGVAKIEQVGNKDNSVEWEPEGWKL